MDYIFGCLREGRDIDELHYENLEDGFITHVKIRGKWYHLHIEITDPTGDNCV